MSVTEEPLAHEAHDDFPDLAADQSNQAQAGSLLASLQRKRDQLARQGAREVRKLVPLWDGALSIVYRYPDAGADPIVKAIERAQHRNKPKEVFAANCNALIACCHTVEGRQPDGDWEPLDPNDPSPLKITRRLADLLQIDVPDTVKSPAQFIVRHVFSPTAVKTGVFDGDIALMTQAGQVINWLSAADDQADEALAGE